MANIRRSAFLSLRCRADYARIGVPYAPVVTIRTERPADIVHPVGVAGEYAVSDFCSAQVTRAPLVLKLIRQVSMSTDEVEPLTGTPAAPAPLFVEMVLLESEATERTPASKPSPLLVIDTLCNLDNLKDMDESRHRQAFCPHTSTKKSLRTASAARRPKLNQTVFTAEVQTVSHRR